jgi:uncharacterized protein
MMGVTAHPPGIFCWPELATTDIAAAVRFYAALFRWTAEEMDGGGHPYTMFRLDDLEVGGAYRLSSDEPDQVPRWTSYISVDSVDVAAARAQELGGRQLAPPADVIDAGRMAVLADPSGATFCVWEAGRHIGAQVFDVPGALCWTELSTPNLGAAEGFYTKLFGWKTRRDHAKSPSYVEVMHDGKPLASMLRSELSPHLKASSWMPYFAAADVDDALAIARRHFGKLLVPPTDLPGVGRYAVLRDPLGAPFGIFGVNEAA